MTDEKKIRPGALEWVSESKETYFSYQNKLTACCKKRVEFFCLNIPSHFQVMNIHINYLAMLPVHCRSLHALRWRNVCVVDGESVKASNIVPLTWACMSSFARNYIPRSQFNSSRNARSSCGWNSAVAVDWSLIRFVWVRCKVERWSELQSLNFVVQCIFFGMTVVYSSLFYGSQQQQQHCVCLFVCFDSINKPCEHWTGEFDKIGQIWLNASKLCVKEKAGSRSADARASRKSIKSGHQVQCVKCSSRRSGFIPSYDILFSSVTREILRRCGLKVIDIITDRTA